MPLQDKEIFISFSLNVSLTFFVFNFVFIEEFEFFLEKVQIFVEKELTANH